MSDSERRLSRRTTIAWMMAASASAFLMEGGPSFAAGTVHPVVKPTAGAGYGTDPKLLEGEVTWPLTLTPAQRETLRICADLILPEDAHSPSAGKLPIDSFIDEWVSAPYPRQQADREIMLWGLGWLDEESQRRNGVAFAAATDAQRRAIFDDIAWKGRVKAGYDKQPGFFWKLRGLVLAGFYTLPEGIADLGYKGNAPIAGPYPGPSPEAMAHLDTQLRKLGLPKAG